MASFYHATKYSLKAVGDVFKAKKNLKNPVGL